MDFYPALSVYSIVKAQIRDGVLNEIIQYEPTELFDDELLGRLATLGIEKGRPFNPGDRMQGIFDQAAKQGVAMSRAIVYASRDPEIDYWPERHWEKMFVRNTEFMVDDIVDVDAQTLWLYQAICVSPSLLSTTPGVGTSYLTAFRDKDGDYLLGDKQYRLRVPAKPPRQAVLGGHRVQPGQPKPARLRRQHHRQQPG